MTGGAEGSLGHPFAAYPMVAADEATGRVAAVYADIAGRMPFVPSVFKSLALCPPYLVLAWQQSAPVLDRPEFTEAATAVRDGGRSGAAPAVGPQAAEVLREFTGPLARMLLLSCGLHAALHGAVSGDAADGQAPPAPDGPVAETAPSPYEAGELDAYGRLRAALDTPIVNTVWRQLAASGQLTDTVTALEEAAHRSRGQSRELQTAAYRTASRLPWSPVASRVALREVGMEDAAPGMSAVLEAYIKTLPRVLVLVADL